MTVQPVSRTQPVRFVAPWHRFVARAFGIAALNLLTVGLYKAHGLTRTRQALYPSVLVGNEALRYDGDAQSLSRITFYPSLVFFLLLIGPGIAQFFVPWVWVVGIGVSQALLIVAFYHHLFFRNRQYELAHVRWHGRDFCLTGSAMGYMWRAMGSQVVVLLTAGALAPWRRALLARYTYGAVFIGPHPVTCEVRARPLLPLYFLGWGLSLLGLGAAVWYYWRVGLQPVITVLQTGAADPALAGSVNAEALAASSGLPGAVPKETLAQIGTFINGIVLAFTLYPAWVVWRLLCLSPYEAAWQTAWADSTRCRGAYLRYEGGAVRPFIVTALSFVANFMTANLSRPFTTFFKLRQTARSFVVVGADSLIAAPLPATPHLI